VHTDSFSGPALIIGQARRSSPVTNLELYLIFPLRNNEESTISLVRGHHGHQRRWCSLALLAAGSRLLVARQIVLARAVGPRAIAERFARRKDI